jgi:hypothetical protein
MALAHTIKNKVEAAYRRGNLLQRRRQLMSEWEEFCLSGTQDQQVLTISHADNTSVEKPVV